MKTTENGTTKQRKPRPKPARAIKVLEQPTADTDGWGAIEITVGKKTDRYLVHFIPSDFGFGAVGFEVEKLDADLATVETYHVHLADKPELCSCDCRGHEQHGHCKHREGLQAVVKAGKFPRIYSARDARREPEGQEPPQLDEFAYYNAADEAGSYDPAG